MLSPKAVALNILLASAVLTGRPSAKQASSPVASGPPQAVKLDNMPLSQLYAPGTQTIAERTRKAMYDQASVAYMKKFALEHQDAPELVAKFTEFLLPTDHNDHGPEGYDTFSGLIDVAIKKGRAAEWTAYRIIVLTADTYQKELDRAAPTHPPNRN